MFLRTLNDLEDKYEFFQLRYDGRGKKGFTTLQKCVVALRLMTFGVPADAVDDYLKMSAKTASESMYNFCDYIIEFYGDIYLWKPTRSNVEELYVAHQAEHGLPGMFGSISCMHRD